MDKFCYNCMRKIGDSKFCPHCGFDTGNAKADVYHLVPGTVLSNRYIVGRAIGEGGFGITYIGLDKTLSKRVAIKEFYPSGAANRANTVGSGVTVSHGKVDFYEKGIERFLDEAKNLAALSEEEGIVYVLDFFRENNTAYIVMEYIEGVTLKKYLAGNGTLSPEKLLEMMLPVMKSLRYVHSKGLVHRDISPDNIMISNKGKLKLMDFGSARYFTNEDREMSVMLKQGFAPEEQYRKNGKQGPFTDVYALCATMYTCLTGRIPESGIDRIIDDTLQPPSQLGVNISPTFENALMHGLAVYAKDRTPDMDSLIREFNGEASNVRAGAVVQQGNGDDSATRYADDFVQKQFTPTPTPTPTPSVVPQPSQQPMPQKKSKAPIIVLISVLAVLVVGGVVAAIIVMNNMGKNINNNNANTNNGSYTSSNVLQSSTGYYESSAVLDSSDEKESSSYVESSSKAEESSGASSESSDFKELTLSNIKKYSSLVEDYFKRNLKEVISDDSDAQLGDTLELKNIYHIYRESTGFTRIVYVYYNSTRGYYKQSLCAPDSLRIYQEKKIIGRPGLTEDYAYLPAYTKTDSLLDATTTSWLDTSFYDVTKIQ